MKTIYDKLELEFQKIKEWKQTKEKNNIPFEDDDYPNWNSIYTVIKSLPDNLNPSISFAKTILYFLAKDNETENIMEILKEKVFFGHCIAKHGVEYSDMDARWQVAVLLGYFHDSNLLLKILNNDSEEYVRRRALLALRDIDKIKAEEVAIKNLSSIYQYERMIALDTLLYVSSSYLNQALEGLQEDNSIIIKNKIKKIKEAL